MEPKHPHTWNKYIHYGNCGQSCPCCRARVEGPKGLGICPVCAKHMQKYNK